MKTKEVEQNVKLGLFVFVGLILFFAIVFLIGSENNVFNKTFNAYAVFKNVEGLKSGDNVWLSGVKIGTVKDVRIVSEGRVIVTLSLKDKQNQFIKRNATAFIGSDGLVGNKIVVIRPGNAAQTIQDADTIGTNSPTDTQELINIAKDVGDNTRSLTFDLKLLAKRINDGQGIIGELLTDGDFAQDLRASIDQMKTTTTRTSAASEELYAIMHKINNGEGLVNLLATDTTMAFVFNQTLNNVQEVSKNSAEMSKSLQTLVSKLNDKNSALGLLLADSVFANNMKVTLENAQSASAKLDENMDALSHNFLLRGYFRKKEKRDRENEQSNEKKGI